MFLSLLMLELAHLRRIRYGVKNEALSSGQLSLFEEDRQTDIAAIEAEIEQLPSISPQKKVRNCSSPELVSTTRLRRDTRSGTLETPVKLYARPARGAGAE